MCYVGITNITKFIGILMHHARKVLMTCFRNSIDILKVQCSKDESLRFFLSPKQLLVVLEKEYIKLKGKEKIIFI